MTYPPVKVQFPGAIVFNPFGGYLIAGWILDMQGRPLRPDWQQAYTPDILRAVGEYTTQRLGAAVDGLDHPMCEIEAMRITQSLIAKVSQPHRKPSLWKRIRRAVCL